MKDTFGQSVSITLAGESHGAGIVAVLSGMAPGIPVDEEFIADQLTKRRPTGAISTSRQEGDKFEILSGVFNGFTTGTPVAILIRNENTKSKDYSEISVTARPGHVDYSAQCKYHGFQDYRGGGHFSGRITAGIVAAGAICVSALAKKGIKIGTHIAECAGIPDKKFENIEEDIDSLSGKLFAVLDDESGIKMEEAILEAKNEQDSVGGILETAISGIPSGIGEPYFDSIESQLAHMLFSIPAVKGVEFGAGFDFAKMRGSEANDPFRVDENGFAWGPGVGDDKATVLRPVKELKGFQKITLTPGETKQVTFTITSDMLKYWSEDAHDWVAEAGKFTAYVGSSSTDIRGKVKFSYE